MIKWTCKWKCLNLQAYLICCQTAFSGAIHKDDSMKRLSFPIHHNWHPIFRNKIGGTRTIREHFPAIKKWLTCAICGKETFSCEVHSCVSGGNQQICFATKERHSWENIQEKSFKTSETHRAERARSIFFFFLSSLPLYCYHSSSTFERQGMSETERFKSSGKTFFFFLLYQKCFSQFPCWSPTYLLQYVTEKKWDETSCVIIYPNLKLWSCSLLHVYWQVHHSSLSGS